MIVLAVVGAVLGATGSVVGIWSFIRQVRLERHIARGVRCALCGVSDRDPAARQACPRNPDGLGHTYAFTV